MTDDLDLPARVGPYRVIGVLGRGGMGIVYDVVDDQGRRWALKTVPGLRARHAQAVRRELHTLARLRHPGIVAIVDEGEQASAPWYAMEYVEGPTLRSWRRALLGPEEATVVLAPRVGDDSDDDKAPTVTHAGDPIAVPVSLLPTRSMFAGDEIRLPVIEPIAWDPARAAALTTGGGLRSLRAAPLPEHAFSRLIPVVRRLCLAVGHLHGAGFVHRDLKPDNVIVRPGGLPVLIDFGLAFSPQGVVGRDRIDDLATLGAGTAAYMAPEQARGDVVDARADVYALGCILFELVAGHPPFSAPTVPALLQQHLLASPPSLRALVPWVPASLDDLVQRMLAKEPRARVGHAVVVAHALAAAVDGAGVDEQYGPVSRPVLYRPTLAGRAEVLDALSERLARIDREGGLVLLAGASGVGKTRVAVEVARRATSAGVRVLAGEAVAHGHRPLAPLRRVLQLVGEKCLSGGQDKTATLLGDRARIIAAYEPSLVLVPGFDRMPEPEPLPAEQARQRLFDSLLATFASFAADEPLLVMIDDLQWADELTVSFLSWAAAQPQAAPLLFLATVRAEEGAELLDSLEDQPGVTTILLDRLPRAAIDEMVVDALGGADVGAPFRDAVAARAEGLPFTVTELLHSAVDDGVLVRDGAGGFICRPGPLALPSSLTELLGRRLRGLPLAEQAVVDATAILGRGADVELVQRLAGLDDAALADAAAGLRVRQIVDVGPDGVRFTHDKLAEAAVACLSPKRRVALHAAAAAALTALPPARRDELAERIGEHLAQSGAQKEAAPWFVVAGDRARSLYAFRDAERCYEAAIRALDEVGDVDGVARTLMKLGLVHAAAFSAAAAQRAWERAFSLWGELQAKRGEGPAVTPTATLRVTNQPRVLDPARAYDSDTLFVLAQIFEGLVELDGDSNVLPGVAARWEISDDGLRYVFHLREDAQWSDGTPVDAADFELSFKRTLHPRMESPAGQLLHVLAGARAFHEGAGSVDDVGVRALDARTLELRLASPSAFLLHLLSHPVAFPVPTHALQEHGERWTAPGCFVGNGAFVLAGRTARQTRLRRNPLYTGRATGNVAELEIDAYRAYEHALDAYARGELDMLDMIAADAACLKTARERWPTELRWLPLHCTQYVTLRADRAPLDDVRVRKAFALALDRDALARTLAGTAHVVARGGFIAPGVPAHSPNLALGFDLERAAALLAEAGFGSASSLPPLRWLNTHGLGDPGTIAFVRESWARLGATVDFVELEYDEFVARTEREPGDIAIGTWIADYPDPDTFTRAVFHSRDGAERTGFASDRFDALVEQAASTTDQRARMELYRTADHLLVADQVAVIPLSYGQDPVLWKPRVARVPEAPSYLRAMKNVVVDDG